MTVTLRLISLKSTFRQLFQIKNEVFIGNNLGKGEILQIVRAAI